MTRDDFLYGLIDQAIANGMRGISSGAPEFMPMTTPDITERIEAECAAWGRRRNAPRYQVQTDTEGGYIIGYSVIDTHDGRVIERDWAGSGHGYGWTWGDAQDCADILNATHAMASS